MKTVAMLAFCYLFVAEVKAANISRIAHLPFPKRDAESIVIAFRKAAKQGNFRKINKAIKFISKHDLKLDHRDLEWVLQDVAKSGNPKAIDHVARFTDKLKHPYDYYDTFGFMVREAAMSGNLESIDLVMKLADKHALQINADDFSFAMARAAERADSQTMRHISTIAANTWIKLEAKWVKLEANHFGNALTSASRSGEPEAIALVVELATDHDIRTTDKYFGQAMEIAAGKNYHAVRQVIKLVDERGIRLDRPYFVEALAHSAEKYSGIDTGTLKFDSGERPGYKAIATVVDFAAEQSIKLNADDFGLAMARAARNGNTKGVRKVVEFATQNEFYPTDTRNTRYSITLNRRHFVVAMQEAVQGGHYRTLNHTLEIATEYDINFNADDFVDIMLEAMESLRFNALLPINDLALKYGVKLEKKHFSRLLAKAVKQVSSSTVLNDEVIDMVIEFTTSFGIKADAEYFATARTYLVENYNNPTALRKLEELTVDYGVKLNAEDV